MCKLDHEQTKRKNRYCRELKGKIAFLPPLLGLILIGLECNPWNYILKSCQKRCKSSGVYRVVEIYVFVFLLIELLFFVLMTLIPTAPKMWGFPYWIVILILGIITFILGTRMVDISQSWLCIFIIQRKGTRKDSPVLSPVRTLILILINYCELIISFSVIGYIWNLDFKPNSFSSISDSLYFTLNTMTTIGSVYIPDSLWAWILYITEISFGLFFLIIIIARVLILFDRKEN